jgi:hypothetical protein
MGMQDNVRIMELIRLADPTFGPWFCHFTFAMEFNVKSFEGMHEI